MYDLEFSLPKDKLLHHHETHGISFQGISCTLAKYSLSPGFWQSFISIEVCKDCTPALASSFKKTINGFLCLLIVFLKSKTYQLILKDVIKLNRNLR